MRLWKQAGFWLALVVGFASGMTALAAKGIGSDEIKQLLTGNTAEEVNIKHGYKFKTYFDPNGQFRRVDEHGNKSDGEWKFEKDGELCINARKYRCWILKPTDKEHVYNVHARFGGEHRKVWTIVKGNPAGL